MSNLRLERVEVTITSDGLVDFLRRTKKVPWFEGDTVLLTTVLCGATSSVFAVDQDELILCDREGSNG